MKFFSLKNCAWFFVAIFAIAILYNFLFLNDELHVDHITSHMPYHSEWEISSLEQEDLAAVDKILAQSFVYLNEGGQAYVFCSTDQKYVLKLFKFNRFRPSFLVNILPNIFLFKAYRDKHIAKRENKLITAFNGHKLAYERYQHESGLIFIQLNPSHSSKVITVVDKKNHQRKINLGKLSYILQKKGDMLSTDLSRILNQGNIPLAKQRINQVFHLYLSEYQKGIYDLDYGIMHNIGCIGDTIFHLDVGKLTADERIKQVEFYQAHLIKTISKLQLWIHQQYPQYSPELTEYIEESLSLILNKKFKFTLSF